MKVNYFGFTWNNVFRKDIIDQFAIRFVENLPVSEDEVFTLAYCNQARSLKIIPDALYHYRWKSQGLTHKQKTTEEWILLADSFRGLLTEIDDKALVEDYHRRIVLYYNIAAWSSNSVFRWIKNEWRMLNYCRKNHVPLPRRAIVAEFIKKIR